MNLPEYEAKITKRGDKLYIMDIIRHKYVALTPEEWVRQHFVNYLITDKGFPKELIANEVLIKLNDMPRRCDTVVYDKHLNPIIIIGYKAMTVGITEKVFDQIVRYNMVLNVEYLIVSNGIKHYCCKMDSANQQYSYLSDIPHYSEIVSV